MVGNKVDLEKDREVTYLEASRFAQENGLLICFPFLLDASSLMRHQNNHHDHNSLQI